MKFSFTRFKDRTWFGFDAVTRWLATAPSLVQDIGFGLLGSSLWLVYALPGNPLRKTTVAFSETIGQGPPRALFAKFVRRFALGQRRMEILRSGQTDQIDPLLMIPQQARIADLLRDGNGIVLVMPHCHASVVIVRGLALRFPTLMLVREAANPARAASQQQYYDQLGCEVLDVRSSNDATVARAVLNALRQGKIVIGVVDRIKDAPPADAPIDKGRDAVRAMAFGAPVGVVGWPVRFATKCGAPILPAMVEQSRDAVTLHLADPITLTDPLAASQAWLGALETLMRRYPHDWLFVYDKYWSRVLQKRLALPPAS